MKKKFTYLLLLVFFFCMTAFVFIRYGKKLKSQEVAFYPLLERKGTAALLPEWASTKNNGDKLIRIVRETPTDTKSTLALVALYIQEARVTGNYTYYDAAAMKYINDLLAREPQNFEALILKAILQLSQHHFSDALQTAATAQKINPYNAFVYGIMVDGNVEMGNYPAAVENSDKMMSIRPDIRSYARVSYLREIHGDYPGAIEAMKMAVEAGAFGNEGTEWSRIQLARLYESTGEIRTAEMHYTVALDERPGYGYAIAGLGHIAMANKDYAKAISLYQQADSVLNDYALKEQLAELYVLTAQKEKAATAINNIIDELTKAAKEGEQSINHHADKELAYVYLLKNEPGKALDHAMIEYNRRPDNIDVNEAVAWAYYKNDEAQKALPYVEKALRTNCKNPVLLSRAGLIFAKTGDAAKAKSLLQQAQKNNPNIDPLLKQEADAALKTL
ncbi:MAG: tetratricopeptide repeat protein [Flavisolibacter sp.]